MESLPRPLYSLVNLPPPPPLAHIENPNILKGIQEIQLHTGSFSNWHRIAAALSVTGESSQEVLKNWMIQDKQYNLFDLIDALAAENQDHGKDTAQALYHAFKQDKLPTFQNTLSPRHYFNAHQHKNLQITIPSTLPYHFNTTEKERTRSVLSKIRLRNMRAHTLTQPYNMQKDKQQATHVPIRHAALIREHTPDLFQSSSTQTEGFSGVTAHTTEHNTPLGAHNKYELNQFYDIVYTNVDPHLWRALAGTFMTHDQQQALKQAVSGLPTTEKMRTVCLELFFKHGLSLETIRGHLITLKTHCTSSAQIKSIDAALKEAGHFFRNLVNRVIESHLTLLRSNKQRSVLQLPKSTPEPISLPSMPLKPISASNTSICSISQQNKTLQESHTILVETLPNTLWKYLASSFMQPEIVSDIGTIRGSIYEPKHDANKLRMHRVCSELCFSAHATKQSIIQTLEKCRHTADSRLKTILDTALTKIKALENEPKTPPVVLDKTQLAQNNSTLQSCYEILCRRMQPPSWNRLALTFMTHACINDALSSADETNGLQSDKAKLTRICHIFCFEKGYTVEKIISKLQTLSISCSHNSALSAFLEDIKGASEEIKSLLNH